MLVNGKTTNYRRYSYPMVVVGNPQMSLRFPSTEQCSIPLIAQGTVHIQDQGIAFQCNEGLRPEGRIESVCENGQWNPRAPTCTDWRGK